MGQVEVEVAGAADTTVVVVNPGWGDGVQAAKAGLLEIGDVFVVNKADRDGLDATVRDLRAMLALAAGACRGSPPIVETVATDGSGRRRAARRRAGAHRAASRRPGELAGRRERRTSGRTAGARRGSVASTRAR